MTDAVKPSDTNPHAEAGVDEQTGWLIERDDPPVYHLLTDDYDECWTPDASKALRFARCEDAQAYSDHIGWTSPPVRVVEHLWTDGPTREVVATSNGHHWVKTFNLMCCRDCGIVRRANDKNNPCKGLVKIALRTKQGGQPADRREVGMESMLGRPYGQEKGDVTCMGSPCGWPTCDCGRV